MRSVLVRVRTDGGRDRRGGVVVGGASGGGSQAERLCERNGRRPKCNTALCLLPLPLILSLGINLRSAHGVPSSGHDDRMHCVA